jgi:hypothetical protein
VYDETLLGPAAGAAEEGQPTWDIGAGCTPAPFNIMITCYTLFERDRCARPLLATLSSMNAYIWRHLLELT